MAQMGIADMKTDMSRMQELHDTFMQMSQKMKNYAMETKDPYAWCSYMNMMNDMDSHRMAMMQMIQAMREEQSAGVDTQMSQMHMKMAPAMMGMMGEKMRM